MREGVVSICGAPFRERSGVDSERGAGFGACRWILAFVPTFRGVLRMLAFVPTAWKTCRGLSNRNGGSTSVCRWLVWPIGGSRRTAGGVYGRGAARRAAGGSLQWFPRSGKGAGGSWVVLTGL
jgi:hypothetical protein